MHRFSDEEKKAWGAKIKRLMIAKGLTQAQLARALGGRRMANVVCTWVNGRSYPGSELALIKLADALGVTVEEISLTPWHPAHRTEIEQRVTELEKTVTHLLVHGLGVFG